MDAARAALERDDAWNWRVPTPRILTPLFPASLLSPRAMDVDRRIVGPEQAVPWPDGAAWLDYEPLVAAIIGNEASRITPDEVRAEVFGYTLVNDWRARSADGAPVESADGVPISVGPCVVTADELDPADDVRAGEGRRARRDEGEPQRHRDLAVRADRVGVANTPCSSAAMRSRSDRSRRSTMTPTRRAACGRERSWSWPPRASARCGTASRHADHPPYRRVGRRTTTPRRCGHRPRHRGRAYRRPPRRTPRHPPCSAPCRPSVACARSARRRPGGRRSPSRSRRA